MKRRGAVSGTRGDATAVLDPWWSRHAVFAWGASTYLLITLVSAVEIWRRSGHRMVYSLDDAAIHLVIARNLANHLTWGVVPHHYQSASSSVLWTILLAVFIRVAPRFSTYYPLLINVAGSLALIYALDRTQKWFRPSRRRPLDAVAVVVLVNVVLFLPALSVVGMEHTLHMAVVYVAVILVVRDLSRPERLRASWLVYVAFAVGELLRFETIFVAAGLALALVIPLTSNTSRSIRERVSYGVSLVAATVVPLCAYGVVNRLMGAGWLPNSVISHAGGLSARSSVSLKGLIHSLTVDHLLFFAFLVGVGVCVWGIRHRQLYAVVALAFVVAVILQASLAKVGQYDRYESYLFVILLASLVGALGAPTTTTHHRSQQTWALAGLVAATLVISQGRLNLTVESPRSAADVYDQKYTAGVFLERFYAHQPVASGELGWISWLHQGPFTDLIGLGDYDVLRERQNTNGLGNPSYWESLSRRDGFRVVVMYPETLVLAIPSQWTLVGTWHLARSRLTAYDRRLQFWATITSSVAPLARDLRLFRSSLPDGETLTLSPAARAAATF